MNTLEPEKVWIYRRPLNLQGGALISIRKPVDGGTEAYAAREKDRTAGDTVLRR
jgi:hypothetical protein